MGYKIIIDGDTSLPPLVVVVDENKQRWYRGRFNDDIDKLPEQEWPEVERQSTGSNLMDTFLDWLG